ncbi:MAG: small basic protein [Candidatus Omnitrophica bacterium]|nr:small basic protein [Candidatus Omnitrophota bacterium]
MSTHPSLKAGSTSGKFRSVLKRFEKVASLAKIEKWDNETSSPFKLPKIKILKFKVKKSKGAAEEKTEGAEKDAPKGAKAAAAKPAAAKPAAKSDKK